jgi:hypothetical protein
LKRQGDLPSSKFDEVGGKVLGCAVERGSLVTLIWRRREVNKKIPLSKRVGQRDRRLI